MANSRNIGFKVMSSENNKLIKTPYLLFMDSDVFSLDPKVILRSYLRIHKSNLDLVTVKFRSDNSKFNYVYKTFDFLQALSKWSTPFCLGGFMISLIFRNNDGFDKFSFNNDDIFLFNY
jgi:hypothetical protein